MDLKDQIDSVKSAWGAVLAAVAVGPLALWTSDLQPPSPSGSFVVATVACAVAIWLVISLKSIVRQPRTMKMFGMASLLLGLILGAMYFGAFFRYVEWIEIPTDTGTRAEPVVVGIELRPGVLLDKKTAREALLDNLGDATKIWTESSIKHANEILLALFVGTFFFLTLGSGSIAMSRRSAVTVRSKA